MEAFESERSEFRALQLVGHPLTVTGDLEDLQAIHHHLFQDVYEWAGQLRTVDLEKAGQHFMDRYHLEHAAQYVFGELRDDAFLQGMSPDRFADRLAHHYDQVNHLHPFREGNGRTQRVFWSQVAQHAGYDLNWSSVTGSTNNQASHTARVERDLDPLRKMFTHIATPRVEETRSPGRPARARVDMRTLQEQIDELNIGGGPIHSARGDDGLSQSRRQDRGPRR